MRDKKIAQITIGLPILRLFDYSISHRLADKIKIGCRVKVIFNHRLMVGYCVGLKDKSEIKNLKPILKLIDENPIISGNFLSFLKKTADYYYCSIGEMIEAAIPKILRKGKPIQIREDDSAFEKERQKTTDEFKAYVYCVKEDAKKTEFFIKNIADALENKKQVILLLPDTSLISIWQSRLEERFKTVRIGLLHSRLRESQALSNWLEIKSCRVDIVIGSRLSIFAPLNNLGLIIVDNEDSFVYKQETRPYYNAKDVAIMLAQKVKARLILSSIAPSLETFRETEKNRFRLIIDEGYLKSGLPEVKLINLKIQSGFKKRVIFSLAAIGRIQRYLDENKKILIFLNRKGFATSLSCRHCGFLFKCERCSSRLIYYYREKLLHCPYCNYKISEPKKCPQCEFGLIYFGGFGIERVESEAHRVFPNAKILLIDSLKSKAGITDSQIIISTQLGLKEAILQNSVDLCVIVSIDNMLNFVDLRSSEYTFRTLLNLRFLTKSELIIQTFIAENKIFKYVQLGDYVSFARDELAQRKNLRLPPYQHMIAISLRGPNRENLEKFSQQLFYDILNKVKKASTEVFSPLEDSPYRLRGKFRLRIFIKTSRVEVAKQLIAKTLLKVKTKGDINIAVNVDI
ncbi:MAG: primosomal protein N' [Candidatus Omnitrophota bacterium]